jgi:hypothetical protein
VLLVLWLDLLAAPACAQQQHHDPKSCAVHSPHPIQRPPCSAHVLTMQDEAIPWLLGGAELDGAAFALDTQALADSLDPNLILDSFHTAAHPSDHSGARQLLLDSLLSDDAPQPGDDAALLMEDEEPHAFLNSKVRRCIGKSYAVCTGST